MIAAIPYTIHPVLTEHGGHVTHRTRDPSAWQLSCDRLCQAQSIDHRLTTTNHPWTTGHVERRPRTRQDATVKTSHDQTHHHLQDP